MTYQSHQFYTIEEVFDDLLEDYVYAKQVMSDEYTTDDERKKIHDAYFTLSDFVIKMSKRIS